MKYHHVFRLHAPIERVVAFHLRADSMAAITPLPIFVRFHKKPSLLVDGAEIHFTLWFGPLPVRWVASIGQVTSSGFVDRQLSGPFEQWVHRHRFVEVDRGITEVQDEVEVQLSRNLFWKIFGLGMWFGLPVLFFYRAWKTKRLLIRQHET